MPQAPRRPCPGAGPRGGRCPKLVGKEERHCNECLPHVKQQTRRYDRQRDKSEQRQFLHSTRWRAIRNAKLNADPLCERHEAQGLTVAASLVHHIDRNETNCEESNLESLCTECHEKEHAGERFGKKAHG